MFIYPTFDVIVERKVDESSLIWPTKARASDESLGGNRLYADVRGCSWSDARRVRSHEESLIARIEAADDPAAEYEAIEDEFYDDDDGLGGLDIGVASTVVALSAARCVPFSSCNGGTFGGNHAEDHPLVAFFTRPQMIPLLLEAARTSGAGLENGDDGSVVVYASEIHQLRDFARLLIDKGSQFDNIRFRERRRPRNDEPRTEQIELPVDL